MSARDVALDALAAGLAPVPVNDRKMPKSERIPADCPHPKCVGKRDRGEEYGWIHRSHARLTEAEIKARVRDRVGVVCGAISGGLEVLDVECLQVECSDYPELLAAVRDSGLGRVLEGYVQETGGGGRHFAYRVETARGSRKLAMEPWDTLDGDTGEVTAAYETLAEIKGEGGFVVLAPTAGYVVLAGGFDTIPNLTAEESLCLDEVVARFDRRPEKASGQDPVSGATRALGASPGPRVSSGARGDGLRPGDAYNASHTCWDVLGPAGYVVHHEAGPDCFVTRPGKDPADGWSGVWHRDSDIFVNFSSSVPLRDGNSDPGPGYDPFGLLVALEYGGDHSAAASALRSEGFGDAPRHEVPMPTDDEYSAADLPDDEHHHDPCPDGDCPDWVPDWVVDEQHRLNEMDGLVKTKPTAPSTRRIRPFDRRWTAAELDAEDDSFRWVVNGFLVEGTYAAVGGPKKSLKTEVGANLTVAVATGGPFLGNFRVYMWGPVVVSGGVGGRKPFTRRLRKICKAFGVKLADLPIHVRPGAVPVTSAAFQEKLALDLEEVRPVLVWVDPWYAYAGAELSASQLNEVGAALLALTDQVVDAGAALVVNAHTKKSGGCGNLDDLSGSGLPEWADTWMLICVEQADVEHGLFKLALTIGSRQWGGRNWIADADLGRYDDELGSWVGTPSWALRPNTGESSDPKQRDRGAAMARARILDVLSDQPWAYTKTEVRSLVTGKDSGVSKPAFDTTWDAIRGASEIVAERIRRVENGRPVTRDLWAPGGSIRPGDVQPAQKASADLGGLPHADAEDAGQGLF